METKDAVGSFIASMFVAIAIAVGGVLMQTDSVGKALYVGAFLGWAVHALAVALGFIPVAGPILLWFLADSLFSFVGVEPLLLLKIYALVECVIMNVLVTALIVKVLKEARKSIFRLLRSGIISV